MERPIDVRGVPAEPAKKEHRGTKRKQTQPLHDLRQGSRGLRRPKRPLSFQIPGAQKDLPHRAPSTGLSVSTFVEALEKRIHLINLIVRRNKNQHRNQSFFKHLCLLRTSLARLLSVSSQLFELSRSTVSVRSSEQVRRNFEIEASLRSQKDVVEGHVREVLVPKCFMTFSRLVGDSQFGNLGVVLVALLSEIACGNDGVGAMRMSHDGGEAVLGRSDQKRTDEQDMSSAWFGTLLGTSTRVTGEDQGEVVERVYDRSAADEEHGTGSEASETDHQAVSENDGSGRPSRGVTPQNDMGGVQPQGQPRRMAPADLEEVKQTSRKVSKGSKTNKEITKKKSKKSKNPIDDLFSGLF